MQYARHFFGTLLQYDAKVLNCTLHNAFKGFIRLLVLYAGMLQVITEQCNWQENVPFWIRMGKIYFISDMEAQGHSNHPIVTEAP